MNPPTDFPRRRANGSLLVAYIDTSDGHDALHLGIALARERQVNLKIVSVILRLPSFSGHPTCTDVVSVGEDVHCESTTQEVHAGVSA